MCCMSWGGGGPLVPFLEVESFYYMPHVTGVTTPKLFCNSDENKGVDTPTTYGERCLYKLGATGHA